MEKNCCAVRSRQCLLCPPPILCHARYGLELSSPVCLSPLKDTSFSPEIGITGFQTRILQEQEDPILQKGGAVCGFLAAAFLLDYAQGLLPHRRVYVQQTAKAAVLHILRTGILKVRLTLSPVADVS